MLRSAHPRKAIRTKTSVMILNLNCPLAQRLVRVELRHPPSSLRDFQRPRTLALRLSRPADASGARPHLPQAHRLSRLRTPVFEVELEALHRKRQGFLPHLRAVCVLQHIQCCARGRAARGRRQRRCKPSRLSAEMSEIAACARVLRPTLRTPENWRSWRSRAVSPNSSPCLNASVSFVNEPPYYSFSLALRSGSAMTGICARQSTFHTLDCFQIMALWCRASANPNSRTLRERYLDSVKFSARPLKRNWRPAVSGWATRALILYSWRQLTSSRREGKVAGRP